MDELIVRVLNGDATPEEEVRVRRWREASPENESHFAGLRTLWALTDPVPARRPSTPPDPRFILRAAEERRRREGGPSWPGRLRREDRRRARPLRWGTWGLALAAGVAAVAVGIRFVQWSGPGGPDRLAFEAEFTGPRTVGLDDGSLVRLASGARLARSADASERGVRLEGRAFFAVAHDEGRPFVVRTGVAETRVLGTRFEVLATPEAVRTVVVEGRVAVSTALGRVEVPAGSVGRAEAGAPPATERSEDVYALLDWPGGVLLFQATPLEQVAREVGRHFGRTVEVRGESLGGLRISGSFEEQGFDDVIDALCEVAGAECSHTAGGAVIGSDGASPPA